MAASTNVLSRKLKTMDLTERAKLIQPKNVRIIIIFHMLTEPLTVLRATTRIMKSGRVGSTSNRSANLIIASSTMPPMYPDTRPRKRPISVENIAVNVPTNKDTLEPCTSKENRSLGNGEPLSVPSSPKVFP